MNEFLLGDSGITIEHLAERGFAQFDYRLGDFEAEGFATPSGKIELWSETLERLGHDPLPDHATPRIEREPSELRERFPLILLTGEREKNYHHSRFRDQLWLRRQSPDPRLRMHPATAAALEVGDDCWVAVETPEGRGHCQARVLVTDRVLPGVVSTGMGWWRPEAEGPDYDASTVNINTAVSYSGPYDPVTGSPDSRGLPCRVSPL